MILKEEQKPVNVSRMCSRLGVSQSGYYKWLRRKQPQPDPDGLNLRSEIQDIALSYNRYGYRRITVELRNRGITVNHKKVLRLMREDNLLCVKKVFKPQTTNSNHRLRVYQNLAKGLKVTALNQLWVADITYIRLEPEFLYLAAILDVYSRRCGGWELNRNLDT